MESVSQTGEHYKKEPCPKILSVSLLSLWLTRRKTDTGFVCLFVCLFVLLFLELVEGLARSLVDSVGQAFRHGTGRLACLPFHNVWSLS